MTLTAFCSSDIKTHHLNPSSWGVEKEHGNRGVVDLHLLGLCGVILGNAPGEMLVVCSVVRGTQASSCSVMVANAWVRSKHQWSQPGGGRGPSATRNVLGAEFTDSLL